MSKLEKSLIRKAEKNKYNLVNKETSENKASKSEQPIWERQTELLDNLAEQGQKLEREDLLNLAYRLFEHSIDDGLQMAEKWRLTPDEVKGCLERSQFFIKHIKFAHRLKNELKRKCSKVDYANEEKIDELIKRYEEFIEKEEDGKYREILESSAEAKVDSPEAKNLLQQMDKLYAEYLKERELKEKSFYDPRSNGERIAEQHLIKAKRALEYKHYRGDILNLVWAKLTAEQPAWVQQQASKEFNHNKSLQEQYTDFEHYYKAILRGQASYQEIVLKYFKKQGYPNKIIEQFKTNNLIDENLVQKISQDFKLNEFELDKARYRPLDITFKLENRFAKTELVDELNQSLKTHCDEGVEIIYDYDKEEYIVKDIDKEKEIDKKTDIEYEIDLKQAEFDEVDDLTEINGKLAYEARKGDQWLVVVDGQPQAEFDEVDDLTEINGKLAYRARKGDQWLVVVDGQPQAEFDEVDSLKEINGKLAYEAYKGDQWFVVVDGQPQAEFDGAYNLTEINGKLAYEAHKGDKWFVVVDGQPQQEFDGVYNLTEINGKLAYEARKGDQWFVVDGQPQAEFDEVDDLTEINGKLAYRACKGDQWFVVVDGQQLEKYSYIKETKNKYILWGQDSDKLNIREIDKQELENNNQLTDQEQAKLDLLNLVNSPRLDKIHSYFEKESKLKDEYNKSWQDKLKASLEHSTNFAKQLNRLIKQSPQLFLDTVSAKKDRLIYAKVERVIRHIFPELLRQEQNRWSGYGGLGLGGGEGGGQGQENPENYLDPDESEELNGGHLDSQAENRHSPEVMEFRENIDELVVTKILGRYNAKKKRWEKIYFPVSQEVSEPADEVTVSLSHVKRLQRLALPKPLESKIIKERVKGVQADGEEITLSSEVNSLGEVTATNQSGVEKIVYSFIKSRIPEPMRNISAEEYKSYKRRFIKLFGEEKKNQQGQKERFSSLLENLAPLPEDLELFLTSIKDKPPKEQVIAIEKVVREMTFYDYDNGQVAGLKRGKTIEEQMYIMQQRIEELKQTKPELADKLEGKKYAGVCVDFALLNATMLRRAGFMAGVLTGFLPEGKKATTEHAHATAFVVWPDEDGNNKIFSTDGTPPGLPGISGLSLVEKEHQAEQELQKDKEKANQELDELVEKVANQNADEIKKLTNGQLEKVVNRVLKYEVKQSDLQLLHRVLDAYWYTPAKDMELNQIKTFLSREYQLEKKQLKNNSTENMNQPAGKYLFETVRTFIDRFMKDKHIQDTAQGFDLVEDIFETIKTQLSPAEQRSIAAIVTYLRAKKMSSS